MTSSRLAFFIYIVLAFGLMTAQGQTTASLDFEQAGTPKMPFNVNQPVVYNFHLTSTLSCTMHYKVELEVGPDYTDYTVSKKYVQEVNIPARTSKDVKFDVNFRSPELSRGEFGTWASEKNDTGIWENAWYRARITPLVGTSVTVENYDGQPTLIKLVTVYKNAALSPRTGGNDTLYDYKIEVYSSAEDVVTLEVAPSKNENWIDCGSRSYTTPGAWQTLRWENVSLDFDFIMACYRFVGRKQTEVFEGPFWPVNYTYKNESVDPIDGFSSTPFTYRLEFNATKNLDVGLNVWDIDQNEFRLVGKVAYKNVSGWEDLEWSGIMPSEKLGSEGTSSYYFGFYYPESERPFADTREEEGKFYAGPEIILIKFRNATVTPGEGSNIVRYTFGVEVDTSLPVCDIELQTCEPGCSIWKSQGISTYNGGEMIFWEGVAFEGENEGLVKYRFLRVASPPKVYEGPILVKETILGDVDPAEGVLQAFSSTNELYKFTYTLRFDNLSGDEERWVELLVRAPGSVWKSVGGRKQYDSSKGCISWHIKPFSDAEFLGFAEYKFLVNGVESEVFEGPDIMAMYRGLDYEEVGPNRYNYITWVNGTVDLTADLLTSTDKETWKNVGDEKSYAAGTGWNKLVWSSRPGYKFYEVGIKLGNEQLENEQLGNKDGT